MRAGDRSAAALASLRSPTQRPDWSPHVWRPLDGLNRLRRRNILEFSCSSFLMDLHLLMQMII